jgi:hypothetical protein
MLTGVPGVISDWNVGSTVPPLTGPVGETKTVSVYVVLLTLLSSEQAENSKKTDNMPIAQKYLIDRLPIKPPIS